MANVTLNVTDAKGQATGTVEAPEALFGVSAEDVQAHIPLIHQVVTAQLAAARQGTHATKTRGMVSGGGKKPWKQKGTGRARQGSIRAPQWYHGGTVFGPQPRDYSQRTPKKMKAAALRYALSDRANAGRVAVVEFGITEPSTKPLSPLWPDHRGQVHHGRLHSRQHQRVALRAQHPDRSPDFRRSAQHVRRDYLAVRGLHQGSLRAFVAAKTEPKEA